MLDAGEVERLKIKEEVKNKMVFLKFDCATRIQTNYLGLNAQFVDSKSCQPVTKTLSVVDMHSEHTAEELKVGENILN